MRTPGRGDDRQAVGHGLDDGQAEGLGRCRRQENGAAGQQFVGVVDGAEEVDAASDPEIVGQPFERRTLAAHTGHQQSPLRIP